MEAVAPVEIMVPSGLLVLVSKVVPRERIYDVEAIEEKRLKAEERWSTYQKRISRAYNKRVKASPFKIGDLVLKVARHVQNG